MTNKLLGTQDVPSREKMVETIYEVIAEEIVRIYRTFGVQTKKEQEYSPVMIGDVIMYREKNYPSTMSLDYNDGSEFAKIVLDIVSSFTNKREPIEDQSIECITFIYSLCKDGN